MIKKVEVMSGNCSAIIEIDDTDYSTTPALVTEAMTRFVERAMKKDDSILVPEYEGEEPELATLVMGKIQGANKDEDLFANPEFLLKNAGIQFKI